MKWEYRVETDTGRFLRDVAFHIHLDNLGNDGWELVAAIPITSALDGSTSEVIYIFKRAKRYI